jgi:hypothetical protein
MRRILVSALLLISCLCLAPPASAQCPGSWLSLRESNGSIPAEIHPFASPGYASPSANAVVKTKTAYVSGYMCNGNQFSASIINPSDNKDCDYKGTITFGPGLPPGAAGRINGGVQDCKQYTQPAGPYIRYGVPSSYGFDATFYP